MHLTIRRYFEIDMKIYHESDFLFLNERDAHEYTFAGCEKANKVTSVNAANNVMRKK